MATFPAEIVNNGNSTDPAVMHTIVSVDFVDGPLGWQQLQTTVIAIASSGRSWTMWLRTSDVIAIVSAIVLLTFALDHYYLSSWYLVRIGGTTRTSPSSSSSEDDKTCDIESGKELGNEADGRRQPRTESLEGLVDSQHRCPSLKYCSLSTTKRVALIARILYEYPLRSANSDGWISEWEKTPPTPDTEETKPLTSASPVEEATEDIALVPEMVIRLAAFLYHQHRRHPLVFQVLRIVGLAIYTLMKTYIFLWQILCWPLVFGLYCLAQIDIGAALDPEHPRWIIPFFPPLLCLTLWTIASVVLLMRTSRMQAYLWKAFTWTYAISWWLFWGTLHMHNCLHYVFYLIGVPRIQFGVVYFVALVPSLATVYLYSGFVRNLVVVIVMTKKLWKSSGEN